MLYKIISDAQDMQGWGQEGQEAWAMDNSELIRLPTYNHLFMYLKFLVLQTSFALL